MVKAQFTCYNPGVTKSKAYPVWVQSYLKALRACGVQAQACRVVGISYSLPSALRARDGDFEAAVDDALEEFFDALEAELLTRAVTGTAEPVVFQGTVSYEPARDAHGQPIEEHYATVSSKGEPITGTRLKLALDAKGKPIPTSVVKRSDALLMFALKGRRKRMYADRQEVTGADGGPQAITVSWQA